MAELVDGAWLQQYVAPQLLSEFKNYKDDFIGVLERAPARAVDKDGIRFNKLINNINFYINKDTSFDPIKVPVKKTLVEWDKMDTDNTEVTDAELRYMAFDKNAEIRVKHRESWQIGVRDYAIQKLAPAANVDGAMPILRTTGETVDGGRKRLTYVDLITFMNRLELLNLPDLKKWFMILCSEHRADLHADRASTQNYRDLQFSKSTGAIERFFKLQFFENNQNAKYDQAGLLKPDGAVAVGTDRNASTFFYAPNTVYHIEDVKTLYKPMMEDTRSPDPKSEFRLHAYGLTDKKQEYGFGALVSGVTV
jgi:hypothetical protein